MQNQMDNGKGVYEVDAVTHLSRMKPIHARWIIGLYDKLRNSEKMIENGFKAATITSELLKCLFFLLQHLSQTSKISPKIGSRSVRKFGVRNFFKLIYCLTCQKILND